MALDTERLEKLRSQQSGVVARWQVVALGGTPNDFRRMARNAGTSKPYEGVLVDHNGELTWVQRASSAVLAVWPAALVGHSALRAEAGPGWRGRDDKAAIQVAVDVSRTVNDQTGLTVRRIADLAAKTQWQKSPPRIRFDEATIDEASACTEVMDALECFASAVRSRRTSAQRLLGALEARRRVRDRELLVGLLTDIRDGTCSVLEHGYLTLVERPHGLPSPQRQFVERTGQGTVYRDAEYTDWGLTVELDGKTYHAVLDQHDLDLDRDLDLAGDGRRSVRLGWGQVYRRPCHTAGRVARVLTRCGWTGTIRACGPGCPAPMMAAA